VAKDNDSTLLKEKLLDCVTDPDPLLLMLEWLTSRLMKLEAEAKVSVEKGKHDESRTSHFSGIRARRFDTRLGTMYLLVPKLRLFRCESEDSVPFCHLWIRDKSKRESSRP